MQKKEITKMVETVVSTKFVAEDGAEFYNEEECKKYEKSALFAVSSMLKRLYTGDEWSFFGHGYDDNELEVFDIQTETDLEHLKRYLYLTMTQNGTSDSEAKRMITMYEITTGHEVIISWDYEKQYFGVTGDGSIDAHVMELRKMIMPKEDKE